MNMIRNKASERQEIEALLPWHAAGTLSRRDAHKVEQAMQSETPGPTRLAPEPVKRTGLPPARRD